MKIINEKERSRIFMEDILSRPLFAHLSSASDGSPRDSPVWFLWEEGSLWILGNYKTDSFPKRIETEPRCAIGIIDYHVKTGLVHHVGFRGTAELEPQVASKVKRLLNRYMGEEERWDPRFHAVSGDSNWVFIKFTPETVVVKDQSYTLRQ
ncbi:pyridoxamine 5'-phosphate oxidase family protein [Shouchella patagoniensis]|uniref:pyridoxamine 5'-phosphate oxidase family protein n=1 Tax=Shouchella patagoniensis TaxID=228576 RepID=UPI001115DC55|nr:pyridoxamine 5'-phosphate oxidase family protein [Shouchella patagoniensis]